VEPLETFFGLCRRFDLVMSCATGLGYMVARLTGKPEIASIVGPVTILLLFAAYSECGLDAFVFSFGCTRSPIKYGFEALMTFWKTVETIPCTVVWMHVAYQRAPVY
jgi:hypothetical protein